MTTPIYCKKLAESLYGKHEDQQITRDLVPKEFWYFAKQWIRKVDNCASDENHHFEGFIYLWIIFNGWASQAITDVNKSALDKVLVAALCFDKELNESFDRQKEDDDAFLKLTSDFASWLPVFKVRYLYAKELSFWHDNVKRTDYVYKILHDPKKAPNASNYAPSCYLSHEKEEHKEGKYEWIGVPNDWAHILSAIYMIRCNLFHGGKSLEQSRDREFVSIAFRILWNIWKKEIPSFIYKTV